MRRLLFPLSLALLLALLLAARAWLYFPYALVFALSLTLTMALTPLAKRLAVRYGAMDQPDPRKVHAVPIPRWGGIAIYLSFYISLAIILLFFLELDTAGSLSHFAGGLAGAADAISIGFQKASEARTNLLGLVLGGSMMVLLGMVDDRVTLPAKIKLLGQIAVAGVLVACGISIGYIRDPFHVDTVYFPPAVTVLGTIFWIVGITNAVNLLDGLDGLLAGVASISAAIFFVVSLTQGQYLVALMLAALCGSALGFLRDNFNPARIFMGDTGSLLIGMLFASLSIMGSLKTNTTVAILVTACVMGLPILDTSMAIVRRFLRGRPIFSPDKEHLHHKLLGSGLTQRQTVLLIYVLNGALGAAGLWMAWIGR
ncbi:MAG: MraY family glycosyltransferase [Candidatus Xenobia bacterium]